jgi:hypothetical protein
MKRALVAAALLAAGLAITPFVHSSDAADRPPGVAKDAWIPINDRVGIVVFPTTKGGIPHLAAGLAFDARRLGILRAQEQLRMDSMVIVEPLAARVKLAELIARPLSTAGGASCSVLVLVWPLFSA